MKKFAILISLALLFFVGCQDDNSILAPTNNLSETGGATKGRVIWGKWIELPEQGLSKEIDDGTGWTVTSKVPSKEDIKIVVEQKYVGGIHGYVKISVVAVIYAGTVKEDTYVTMNVNEYNGTVRFASPQLFNRAVELFIRFEGIDLNDVEKDEISFGYLANDLSIQPAKFKEMQFEQSTGTMVLNGGLVYDLTTYGWTVPE